MINVCLLAYCSVQSTQPSIVGRLHPVLIIGNGNIDDNKKQNYINDCLKF